jgi:hypothetical protein
MNLAKLVITALLLLATNAAIGSDDDASKTHHEPPTKQEREQMAKTHEHMAICLRSEKSMRECHEAMRKECEASLGDRCPMMMHPMMEHHINKQRENAGA